MATLSEPKRKKSCRFLRFSIMSAICEAAFSTTQEQARAEHISQNAHCHLEIILCISERADAGLSMERTFRERLFAVIAVITDRLVGLIREMAPVVLFFFVAFLLIFVLFKLFVSQYAIEFSALSKAAVAALILGKVSLLLDCAESGYRFATYRRIVVVGCKTLTYCVAVILLGVGERIIHSIREAGNIQDGLAQVLANANVDRFLGGALLVSLVVGSYLVVQEISHAMGKGALFRLFFERPPNTGR